MSYINVAIDDSIQEDQPVEEGNYTLTVNTAEEKESKNTGTPMIVVTHTVDGHPNAGLIYMNLVLPTEEDDAKTRRFKLLNLKRYLTLAGVEYGPDGFDVEDLIGASFDAYVTKDEVEQEDPEAKPRFRNSLTVPRLD